MLFFSEARSPVLVEGLVLDSKGILPKGVEDVVAHRRHRILDRLQVHHPPRHLTNKGGQNVDDACTYCIISYEGGVPYTNIRKNVAQIVCIDDFRKIYRSSLDLFRYRKLRLTVDHFGKILV